MARTARSAMHAATCRSLQAGVQSGAVKRIYSLWSIQVAVDLVHFAAVADHVQHESAAAVAPVTDRPQPPTTSSAAQRPLATLPPLATDQKVGGSSPSERATSSPGHSASPLKAFCLPLRSRERPLDASRGKVAAVSL